MAVLSLRQLADLLSAHIAQHDKQQSQPAARTFTYWQLIWLMHSCGLGLSEKTTEQAQGLILRTSVQTQLEHIQHALMRLQGLPQSTQRGSEFASQSIIIELLKIVNPTDRLTSVEDDLFRALQILGGLTTEQQPAVQKLIHLAQSQVTHARLSVVRTAETESWIPADEIDSLVRAHLAEKYVDQLDDIRVVTLDSPMQTPMSWSLEQPEKQLRPLLCLGWPKGSQTSITRQEQRALLAHELCHIRQILHDTHKTAESSTPSITLFEREYEALQCEWSELQIQINSLTTKEQARLNQRWWDANFKKPLLSFKVDIQKLAAAKNIIGYEGQMSSTTQPMLDGTSGPCKEHMPQVRLPFVTLLYALGSQTMRPEYEQLNNNEN